MMSTFFTAKTKRFFIKALVNPSLILLLAPNSKLFSQLDFRGQAVANLSMSSFSTTNTLRYIPELDWFQNDINLNLSPNLTFTNSTNAPDFLRPYRAWVRYTTTYWEWKAGLQKINFGPGKILRSLQWFDQLDPRDPTNQTTGVWGIKGKYASSNNHSLWGWVLMGNDDLKGKEIFKSDPDLPEIGGRIEYPTGMIDLGVTSHLRPLNSTNDDSIPVELRLGIDGYAEYGIGMWFENSSSVILNSPLQPESMVLNTLGIDYTFGIGSGLYLTGEWMSMITQMKDDVRSDNICAIMFSYPVSWLDNISSFITYHPKSDLAIVYLSWQRTLDNVIILFSAYKATEVSFDSTFLGTQTLPGSSGIRFMLTFNH